VQVQVDDRQPVTWNVGPATPPVAEERHNLRGLGSGEHDVRLTVLRGPVNFGGITVSRSWWGRLKFLLAR